MNWLLSKEGQEIYSRALLHGTRRLDVDTKWMAREGVEAAKDYLSLKDNERLRNYLEDKCVEVRLKSQKFARKSLAMINKRRTGSRRSNACHSEAKPKNLNRNRTRSFAIAQDDIDDQFLS